ncbi:KTSC domain-containing protein [Enterovibrio baiacu]|uniref:KTSC domain-containing protein n=1 Tax=Enterovibrio baiacu TaxID=2491023 RepID=UPI001010F6D0|nr:KTSC domain-containing protein [Enterovibrio baiacu]MBE1276335.1 KTSC domain-containing protein [Enterovibrio baiacu]
MERELVNSSNLVSVGYDNSTGILEVEFKNGIYQYFDVPSHIYHELLESNSKGGYLHREVKPNYTFEKI